MHIGVILSLEGSGICFLVLVDKQVCKLDLLLIYALEGSFRPSCIILRRALLSPSISLSVLSILFTVDRSATRNRDSDRLLAVVEQSSLV